MNSYQFKKHIEIYEEQIMRELSQYGEVKKVEQDYGIEYIIGDDEIYIQINGDGKHIMGGASKGTAIILEVPKYPLKILFEQIKKDMKEVEA